MPSLRLSLPLIGLIAALLAAPALAASDPQKDPRETLHLLYRVALSAEVCGFGMSDHQSEQVGKVMDEMLAKLSLNEDESDEFYSRVEAEMEREGWETVCAQGGSWSKAFKQAVALYGK